MKFCTAAEMRKLDEKTINECGIPGVVLMENAGRGAAVLTRAHFGDLAGRRVAVVCGRGNNGGDGHVMARIFHGWGAMVRVFLLGKIDKVGGDAKINLDVALKMGIEVIEIVNEERLQLFDLSDADLIVDAILGTGLNSDVRGLYRDVIEKINRSGLPVAAVDTPSGLDSDTGRILGTAVRADLTVTFGLPKIGLLLPPGEELAGRLEVVDIGIPPHVLAEADPGKELLLEDTLRGIIKPRKRTAHKGDFGHVLLLAGSTGKTGAAALAAQAAARSGAGLVTLAVPSSLNPVLETMVVEAMTEPLPEELPGFISAEAADRVLELAEGKSVLAIGPGLGAREGAVSVVRRLVEKAKLPLVIDADGLNAFGGAPELLKKALKGVVITPHPGEMSRLTGLKTSEIQNDRLGAATRFAARHGAITVLKGYRTVVSSPDGSLYLGTTGGPHMASGGMGDILTGMIAGLTSQGVGLLDSTRLAVFAHGRAADSAASEKGPFGVLAGDLLEKLPEIWRDMGC